MIYYMSKSEVRNAEISPVKVCIKNRGRGGKVNPYGFFSRSRSGSACTVASRRPRMAGRRWRWWPAMERPDFTRAAAARSGGAAAGPDGGEVARCGGGVGVERGGGRRPASGRRAPARGAGGARRAWERREAAGRRVSSGREGRTRAPRALAAAAEWGPEQRIRRRQVAAAGRKWTCQVRPDVSGGGEI